MIPLLADAIAQAVRTALAATDDHWVRLECPPHFPVESGLTATDVQRVGRLQQFEDVEIPAQIASSSPSEITAWRNGQDKVPTVVIGAATGAEEAGLRRTRVVSLAEIIETWRALLSDSMASLGDDAAPEPLQALVEHLLVEAGEGKMDAVELDGYFQRVLSAGRGIIAAAGTQLPRIGLARDAQLLGAGSLAARLQLNRSTVDLLAYPAVGPAEERLLRRLEASGAEVARAAQEFRRTLNGAVLDRIELADLRAILDGNRTPGSPRARRLLDYLDAAEPDAVDAIVRAVQGIASDIRLDGQVINASEPVDVPGGELRIQLEPHDDSLWVESDLEEPHADEEPDGDEPPTTRDQVLIGIVEAAEPIDGPDQARLTGSELLELAVDQDRLDGHSRYEPLVRAYLEARQAVVIVARLLVNDDESVLDLLIVKPEASDAAQRYVESWLALLHAAREAPAPPSLLSERLPLLDARWGVGHYDRERLGQLQWARLAPFHPWRLAPLVALARHARSSIGTPQLGSQLRWALDRAVPAYPLVWTGRSALARTGYADGIARYEAENDRTLVRAASGAGLVNVVRSFIEFHPYARDGLALTLVNPPAGGGIPAAIRDLEGLVSRLDVRVATTAKETADLDAIEGVRFLGRFGSTEGWVASRPPLSHILVVFTETAPGVGANLAAGQPTRGSHVALKLDASPSGFGSRGLRAQLTLIPREENDVVLTQRAAARLVGGDDTLMNTSPALPSSEATALRMAGETTEWLVVAVPGPVGVVSQADMGADRLLIGRQDFGPYGLHVYAKGPYAVRKFLGRRVREAPIEYTAADLDGQIAAIADRSPRQLLGLARTKQGVTETVGVLTALEIERLAEITELASDAYETFYLPMDEIGWTQHWLTERTRCDFLRVDVARTAGVRPRMRVRAVESKASRGAISPALDPGTPPWAEALGQVRATLDSLNSVYRLSSPDMLADLRFTSFCEHLFSVCISRLTPLTAPHVPILVTLSDFAARNLGEGDIVFDGVAVATYFGQLGPLLAARTELAGEASWPALIVRATGAAVNSLLTGANPGPVQIETRRVGGAVAAPGVGAGHPRQAGARGEQPELGQIGRSGTRGEPTVGGGPQPPASDHDALRSAALAPASPIPRDVADLAERLYRACERRNFLVSAPRADAIRVGPTLVSVSLAMVAGAAIREVTQAQEDLAREVGVDSVEVSNDPDRPFFLRFLMLRPKREFPRVPTDGAEPVSADAMGYLGVYLGQGLDGTDQQVFMSAWPHALVGGTTGSGKTTLLRSLLTQVSRAAPELGRLIIVDGKGETDYFGVAPDAAYAVPFVGPQTEPNSAVEVVRWILNEEIPRRRRLVREAAETTGARFDARMDFLDAVRVARPPLLVPLLVVIDEFGELMLRGQYRDEFEASVQSIGAMGRSAMIHLVLATQRPERAVVPGIIKGNLPCRIALKLPTTSDSMTILGHGGAERLAGRGDMLYEPPEGSARRLQGYQV